MPPWPAATRRPPRRLPALLIAAGATAISGGLLLLCPPPARPQPLSDKPFPAIEAGMHTAPIVRMGVDREGRYGVTASHDKTARLWDLHTGQQLAVLRVPLGDGDEGKLYAAALSPDGRWVALGGWTGPSGSDKSIYIFDRASGQIAHRIAALPNVIHHLAFSPDGRHLAAALGGPNGIRVFSAASWKPVAADSDYQDSSYSVHFARDGRLVATSNDGQLRLYNPSFETITRRPIPGGNQPFFARFSPDGSRIAVGFNDSTNVSVVSANDLTLLHTADTTAVQGGDISSVAWSADGRRLYAAGRNALPDGIVPIRFWDQRGQGPLQTLTLPTITSTVMDLRPLRDGRLLFASGDPAWGVLDGRGKPQTGQGPPILDHRGEFDAFRLSPAGQPQGLEFNRATWRDGRWRRSLARFDLATRQLQSIERSTSAWAAPRTTGLPVRNWRINTKPRLGELPLPLKPDEISRSLAVGPDSRRFALGSEWYVHLFDAKGQRIWRQPVPSVAWMVNLSADGRFVVAALADGTIRWYRVSNGTEALALFVHGDGERWVLWTPEGFYDASPGADDLIGYHLNQRRDQAGEFVGSDQLAQLFFRPDLISRRLAGDEAAITAAVRQVGDVREVLAAGLPPRVEPDASDGPAVRTLPNGDVEIRYRVVDRGGGVGPIEIRLNGVVIQGRQNLRVGDRPALIVSPPPGKRKPTLEIASRSSRGVLGQPWRFELEAASASTTRPKLHVMAVGITAYDNPDLRRGVKFATADAKALVETLQHRASLADAELGAVVRIPDAQATREKIESELRAFAQRVQPGDRFVLHLAGHGNAIDGEYFFLTREVSANNDEAVRRQALSGSALQALLQQIPSTGGTLLLFDTCSAGTYNSTAHQDLVASVRRFERLDGRLMLAAAGDRRMALESEDGQRGIFTGVVIQGLLGKADIFGNDRIIKASELQAYVVNTVPEITLKLFAVRQMPHANQMGDFPLSRVSSGVGP